MVSGTRKVFPCVALFACASLAIGAVPTPPAEGQHRNLPGLPFAIGNARAVVLYFVASDCPVSNRLLPEMLRIEHEFATRHVRFFFVYPNSTETPASISAHRSAYSIDSKDRSLTDPHETLARLAGANTTPEAAVLLPQGSMLKPVYSGRIDDRFLSLGTERPAATHHDLEDAIAAVLANRPVPPPGGPPVGCAFMTLAAK